MAAITRIGLAGIPRGLYGSFAGKEESDGLEPGPHNPGRITRLGLAGITRGLYGDFSGKEPAVIEPEPEVARQRGGWLPPDRKARDELERKRRQDKDDILATIRAAYAQAAGEVEELPPETASAVRVAANKSAPKSARRKQVLPPVKAVNFEVLAKQAEAIDALLDWYEAKQEDEAVSILLLAA